MGGNLSKEKGVILSTWKLLLKKWGVSLPELTLQKMLLWGKTQGLEVNTVTAFGVSQWMDLGNKLFDSTTRGSKEATELLTTWRLLLETLKGLKVQQDQAEAVEGDGLPGSPGLVSEEKVRLHTIPSPPVANDSSTPLKSVLSGDLDKDGGPQHSPEKLKGIDKEHSYVLHRDEVKTKKDSHEKAALSYIWAQEGLPKHQSGQCVQPSDPPLSITEEKSEHLSSYPPLPKDSDDEDYPMVSQSESKNVIPKNPNPLDPLPPPSVTEEVPEGGGGDPWHKPNFPTTWGLPSASVTVRPWDPVHFWKHVKAKAMEIGDWDLLENISVPSTVAEPLIVESAGPVAFPVVYHNSAAEKPHKHVPYSWKVIQDLQKASAQYGPNSPAVMQLIRLLSLEAMTPYDIAHLAQIIFQPVQHELFRNIWQQRAEAQAVVNLQYPETDPRSGNGVDVFLGLGQFSNPQHQAQWPPLVLEQAKAIGFEAIIRTVQLAEPKRRDLTIKQGPKEPFLSFVEKLQAAVERQVFDAHLREMLVKQLARDNANEDCQKVIETLPRDPALEAMITACAKVGSVEHEMTALATAMAVARVQEYTCYGCGQNGHVRFACPHKGRQVLKGISKTGNVWGTDSLICFKCRKHGHFAKQCHSKFHSNGQPLQQGNAKKSAKGCMQTQIPQSTMPCNPGHPLPGSVHSQPSVTGYQDKTADQPGWMYPPPTQ
ncbi:uncharacterized protein [Patagioenas fasciata]|uniref:uncharacterized protein n=1 Tax=Patagioenas fasciata TaxID=372321 RepID=UPI003A990586